MILYPTIELQKGRCVSLFRGRMEEPQIWHVDPVERAISYAAAGAQWLHVTDFDAVDGTGDNSEIVGQIIRRAGTAVQLGGGFRTLHGIAEAIDRGAGRIVIGTQAVLQPDLVKQAARAHPDQIVLAVDIYQGRVMSHGWRTPSVFEPEDFIGTFESDPLAAIIVTDIDADIDEAEGSLAMVTRLAQLSRAPVIARGLARSLDGLSQLKYVPGISGAIMGRALFDRSVAIEDALALAAAPLEPTAKFI